MALFERRCKKASTRTLSYTLASTQQMSTCCNEKFWQSPPSRQAATDMFNVCNTPRPASIINQSAIATWVGSVMIPAVCASRPASCIRAALNPSIFRKYQTCIMGHSNNPWASSATVLQAVTDRLARTPEAPFSPDQGSMRTAFRHNQRRSAWAYGASELLKGRRPVQAGGVHSIKWQ